jgi:anthranilate synthase component 2
MKLLVLDNYDSFTFNLVHLLEDLGVNDLSVFRNDKISLDAVSQYDAIVLSPGPGLPSEAGIMPELVRRYAPSKKILGVCLGHQCIGESFGAELRQVGIPLHGKATMTTLTASDDALFKDLPSTFETGRYHSWVVNEQCMPKDLEVTAVSDGNLIMAMKHRNFDVRGVQFHPESVLTPLGRQMLDNWLKFR